MARWLTKRFQVAVQEHYPEVLNNCQCGEEEKHSQFTNDLSAQR